jgi:preprotein translocase subunit YajC
MNGNLSSLLLVVALFGLFYLLLIRPQRNRQRQAVRMQSDLAVGAEVMTTAGLFGTVAGLDDQTVTLEVAPGVTNRYIRAAVGKVLTPAPGAGPGDSTERLDDAASVEGGAGSDDGPSAGRPA